MGRMEIPLRMEAVGGATWTDHIEPIYVEKCSACHDGASETVLEQPEQWSSRIDLLLDKVISGEMPLTGEKLTNSEIALIQAWAAGGFAP